MTNQINSYLPFFSADQVEGAFGPAGLVVFSYFLGARLASEIKESVGFFPAMILTGERGAGRSTLIEYLQGLIGKEDYEGVAPSRASKKAITQMALKEKNTPLVFVEMEGNEDLIKVEHVIRGFYQDPEYTRAPIFSSSRDVCISKEMSLMTVKIHLEKPKALHDSIFNILKDPTDASSFFENVQIHKSHFLSSLLANYSFYKRTMGVDCKFVNANYALLAAMLDSVSQISRPSIDGARRAIRYLEQAVQHLRIASKTE